MNVGDADSQLLQTLLANLRRERLRQAVRDLYLVAPQLAHQLHVVVAGHAKRLAVSYCVHHEFKHLAVFLARDPTRSPRNIESCDQDSS